MRKKVGFGLTHVFLREHKKWRSLETCSFKAQGVPELSIFLWVKILFYVFIRLFTSKFLAYV
jgi:hypothetical protein